jgi:hypothetical protein
LQGRICFSNGRTSFDCLIRDITQLGARILFSDVVNLPDKVDLYIPQKNQTIRARVIWRHNDEIGLAFFETADEHKRLTPSELAKRVVQLESEVRTLKRMLNHMARKIEKSDAA